MTRSPSRITVIALLILTILVVAALFYSCRSGSTDYSDETDGGPAASATALRPDAPRTA